MDLRSFRQALGLDLATASDQLGVSKGTLSKIERRKLDPGGELLLRINRWVDEERRRKRLPASSRIDWSYLQPKRRGSAA